MAIKVAPFSSSMPVSPGSVLKDEIEFLGMTQKELASRMGRPTQVISEIIGGKKAVTPETALELESVLGIKAHIWTNLESGYRLTLARNEHQSRLETETELLSDFKVNELEKRGWITRARKRTDKVLTLRRFLGVASLNDYQHVNAAAFRITGGGGYSPQTLAVWLRKGEIDAEKIEIEPYDRTKFESEVRRIRKLTTAPPSEFVPEMKQACAGAGVALVLTQELPKSGANGVARWLTDDKRLIQLSWKWRWTDIFWFTFFHEACHILNHKRDVYIQYPKRPGIQSAEEQEADQFAADILIPTERWNDFIKRRCFTAGTVRQFAAEIDIHPGIVVGRMHHEKLVPYNWLTEFKTRFQWKQTND